MEQDKEAMKTDYKIGDEVKLKTDFEIPEYTPAIKGKVYTVKSTDQRGVYINGDSPNTKNKTGWYLYFEEIEPWVEILPEEKIEDFIYPTKQEIEPEELPSSTIARLEKQIEILEDELKYAKTKNDRALFESVSALYFNDSSDYMAFHYKVVHYLAEIPLVNHISQRQITLLYEQIKPENNG